MCIMLECDICNVCPLVFANMNIYGEKYMNLVLDKNSTFCKSSKF